MDKTGFNIGGAPWFTRVLAVLDGPKRKKANQSTSDRQEWFTLIKCLSAAGRALPPLVIFKGTAVMHDGWLPRGVEYPGWRYCISNKGWSNDTLAYKWLSNIF